MAYIISIVRGEGDSKTTPPSKVKKDIQRLLFEYNQKEVVNFEDIVEFHFCLFSSNRNFIGSAFFDFDFKCAGRNVFVIIYRFRVVFLDFDG